MTEVEIKRYEKTLKKLKSCQSEYERMMLLLDERRMLAIETIRTYGNVKDAMEVEWWYEWKKAELKERFGDGRSLSVQMLTEVMLRVMGRQNERILEKGAAKIARLLAKISGKSVGSYKNYLVNRKKCDVTMESAELNEILIDLGFRELF